MDTLSNMAVKIKNASRAGHKSVQFPYSKISDEVLKALSRAGFVEKVSSAEEGKHKTLDAVLRYENKTPLISEVRRISKPSRRLYRGSKDVRRVRRGYGALILTTSKGVMTDAEARKAKIGGEPLLEVW